MKTGVYRIINISNNKSYIGSSNNIDIRISTHFRRLNKNKHCNIHLQNSYNKYGVKQFKWEILEYCDIKNLLEVEQKYIDNFNKNYLYNKTFITNGAGADINKKPIFLLDLHGTILEEYSSISELNKKYNTAISLASSVNKGAIYKRKYRVVTKEFYKTQINLILTWKKFSSKSIKRSNDFKLKQIVIVEIDNKIYEFKTKKLAGKFLGISSERVRQIILTKNSNKFKIIQKYPIKN